MWDVDLFTLLLCRSVIIMVLDKYNTFQCSTSYFDSESAFRDECE